MCDQLKQKILTNLKQSVVEVWGVSGNKYGRISNLKTLFDTRPGNRGDYFSYKAREELITYWHASSCFDMNVVLLPSIYAKARVCQWRPPLTPHPQRRGRQERQLLRVKLGEIASRISERNKKVAKCNFISILNWITGPVTVTTHSTEPERAVQHQIAG